MTVLFVLFLLSELSCILVFSSPLWGFLPSVFLVSFPVFRRLPASFNLFLCPVFVSLVDVLSSTVYVGAGVQFPQSVCVLVHCPVCCIGSRP